jgi:hypothetical protein
MSQTGGKGKGEERRGGEGSRNGESETGRIGDTKNESKNRRVGEPVKGRGLVSFLILRFPVSPFLRFSVSVFKVLRFSVSSSEVLRFVFKRAYLPIEDRFDVVKVESGNPS